LDATAEIPWPAAVFPKDLTAAMDSTSTKREAILSLIGQRPNQTNTTDLMTALEMRVIRKNTTKTAVNHF
jgi:ABC-type methionine transport system ATPase subunit